MEFFKTFEPIRADMDTNKHMRHTAYNDYATQMRVAFLNAYGYDLEQLEKLKLGSVLFREETIFLREVRLGDTLKVEGAWIDMETRKLRRPPEAMFEKFNQLPKTDDYN